MAKRRKIKKSVFLVGGIILMFGLSFINDNYLKQTIDRE